ncbi:MAG: DUF2079 domain-containing protein [Deltaproteobacteria bacterium]|nr:DUF2079 domain-containing protein [Deltaproteobacteria bacterium]
MRAALAPIEQSLERLMRLGLALVWPLLYAMSLGYAGFSLKHRDLVATLAKNRLSVEQRQQMAVSFALALGVVVLVYVARLVYGRVRRGSFEPMATLGSTNRALAATLALPLAAGLAIPGVETSDPLWTILSAAGAASAVGYSVYQLSTRVSVERDDEPVASKSRLGSRLHVVATALGLAAMWATYGYLLSRLAVTNHHALNTRTIDLGYYDNVFFNSLHGRPLGCSYVKGGTHASAHFDPILVALSPLYGLYPRAEFLLVLQSVWLGMGVIPAYLIAARTLKSATAGWVMALAYAVYPALHGANLYEFHSLTLTAPLVLWLFWFLEVERFVAYGATVVLLCLCREDIPLMLGFVGIHALTSGRRALGRAGLATIGFALVYYVVVRGYFMPSKDLLNGGTDKAYSYAYYFDDLIPNKKGLIDVALTLVTNPLFVLRLAFADLQKLQYLMLLFVPLAALPLVARRGRLTMLYGLAVCLLASRKPVFQVGFQYAAMIFPFAFAIAPRALLDVSDSARVRGLGLESAALRRGVLGFVFAASCLLSWKFGALVENGAFRGGFGKIARYRLSEAQSSNYAALRHLVETLDPAASLLVTNRVGAHVSNRRDVYLMHQRRGTSYVLIEDADLGKQKSWHDERVKKGELELVERSGPFLLYRTVPRPAPSSAAAPPASASASSAPSPAEPPLRPGDAVPLDPEEHGSE